MWLKIEDQTKRTSGLMVHGHFSSMVLLNARGFSPILNSILQNAQNKAGG